MTVVESQRQAARTRFGAEQIQSPGAKVSLSGLFAGIGGFELAFSRAGMDAELLVERDAAPRRVLEARFPNAEIREDVSDLTDLPAGTRIVTAGFPCQNLSMAGDKSGLAGSMSGVVSKLFQLIAKSRVPIVVIENVYFMLQLDHGDAMRRLVNELEQLGYGWAYRVLDSMGFGLPQRRRRVYLIASIDVDPRTILFADESVPNHRISPKPNLDKPLGFYWTEGRSGIGLTVDGVPPVKVGSSLGIPSAPAVLFPDGEVLMPSIETCERLQGFPSGWTTTDNQHIRTKNPRWRMVGNAVSVPVAQWVASRIKSPGVVLDFERVPFQEHCRWPTAAWNVGGGRVGVIATDKPIETETPSIADFRDGTWTRLSVRALDGFIGRAVEGKLSMPEGFLEALRKAPRRNSSERNHDFAPNMKSCGPVVPGTSTGTL
jgi:DNA (cytosine-5)-methyltransferase 1